MREDVAEFVDHLTGKQTIYQMIQLCEEIDRRGGEAADPVEYKKMYHARLWTHIQHRVAAGQGGQGKATTSYGKIKVPAKPSVVVGVDKSNVKAALIDSGYYQTSDSRDQNE